MHLSLSMTRGHDAAPTPVTPGGASPLGYLYAAPGGCDHTSPGPDMGHYDPDSQTWVDPAGFITAGVWTKTRLPCGCTKTDDACM